MKRIKFKPRISSEIRDYEQTLLILVLEFGAKFAKENGLRLDSNLKKKDITELSSRLIVIGKRINAKNAKAFEIAGISRLKDLNMAKEISKFQKTNIDLVRSLLDDEEKILKSILKRGEKEALQVSEIEKQILARLEVSKAKANLLARDQVLKLNGQINQERQTRNGITQYRWVTSRDGRVRPAHAELDNSIQSWDDPPIVSVDGRRAHPGQDYQCRCVSVPIIDL